MLSVGYLVTPSVHTLGDGQSLRRDCCYGPHLYGEKSSRMPKTALDPPETTLSSGFIRKS